MRRLSDEKLIIALGLLIYIPLWLLSVHFSHISSISGQALPVAGGDSAEYAQLSDNLLAHHRFTLSEQAPFTPETFRVIGYPLFMAGIVAVFKSYFAVTLVQALLMVLSAVMILWMGRRMFSPTAGLIAAGLFLIEPTVIYHALVLLSDSVFLFLLIAIAYALFFHGPQKRFVFYAGIMLGLAVLVRPIAIYAVVIFLPSYFWIHWSAMARKKILIASAVFLASAVAVISPWMIRNYAETGILGLSSVTAYNLYSYNVPGFLAWKGMSAAEARKTVLAETGKSQAEARLLENSGAILAVMKRILLADPVRYAVYHWTNSMPFIASSGLSLYDSLNAGAYGHRLWAGNLPSRLRYAEDAAWILVLALACAGLYVFLKKDRRAAPFFAIIMYFWLMTGPVADARYRLPAEPWLIILAVGLLWHISRRLAPLALMYAYALLRGLAKEPPLHPQKILVIQMAKLGDMVCTTPVFRAIKSSDPGVRLTVLGNRLNQQTLAFNPDVDEYLVLSSFRETRACLKREKFDCAFLAGGPDVALTALAFTSGIPLIVAPRIVGGYSPWDTWLYRLAIRLVAVKEHRMGAYAPREYLRLLEPIGIRTEDTSKRLGFSPAAEKRADEIVQSMKGGRPAMLAGISPSAGNEVKEWPPERFAAVADHLIEKQGAVIAVLGGPGDGPKAAEMMRRVRHPDKVRDLQGKLSIDELKAFVSRLDLYIAADTGPIYIAEAFRVPTVDLIGPIDEREQPPIGERHAIVVPPDRVRSQLSVMNARDYDYAEARRLAESISAEQAIGEIDRLIRSLPDFFGRKRA